jgi:phosphoglycolate phosphatase
VTKLLIFDWDGTLMDSPARIVASLRGAMDELGLPPLPTTQLASVIGLGLREAWSTLVPQADNSLLTHLIDIYRRLFIYDCPVPQQLYPGARETLEQCADAGYLLAVATGKSRAGLHRVLGETELGPLFQATRGSDEARSKPDPLMLQQILDELDLPPTEALMVGDTDFDLEMANRCGMPAIGVTYGVHPVERLMPHQPAALIDDIQQLPAAIPQRPCE